ncbi:MAG: chitobiase/beta-hexosaminidase C-terminal domain-containing protein [Bacteroides sp.]|nr:chitobiase/beta-hexosaminidase C-terminal domain-containing protein [Ruminococcus flavefaciens]MCM1555283.1 chitobiase/beta-hexosaminidase C-terminal domain-containing protein [Bacteroides sp.]
MKKLLFGGFTALMMLFSLVGFVRAEDKAKVTVSVEGAWIIGSTPLPKFTVAIEQISENDADQIVMGTGAGNLAVEVTFAKEAASTQDGDADQAKTQILTARNPNVDITGLDAGTWNLTYRLVKGEAPTTAFDGNAELTNTTPSVLTVSEAPVVTFTPSPENPVQEGTEITIGAPSEALMVTWSLYKDQAAADADDYPIPNMYPESKPVVSLEEQYLRVTVTINSKRIVYNASYTVTEAAVKAPVFEPVAGIVSKATDIKITAADGADIWYTLDGTEPEADATKATKYTEAFRLTEACTVKAIAVNGNDKSAVVSAAYTLIEDSDAELDFDTVAAKNYPIMMSIKTENYTIMDAEYDVYYTTDRRTTPSKEAFERNPDSTIKKTGYHLIPTDDGWGRRVYAYAVMESNDTLKAQVYLTINNVEMPLPLVKRAVRVNSIPAPRASVESGLVEAGTKMVLKSDSSAAVIYYTVDGTEPLYERILENQELLYDGTISVWSDTRMDGGDTIVITKDTVIKAIAYIENSGVGGFAGNGTPKDGEPAGSSVVEFRYTVKQAQTAPALTLSPDGSASVKAGTEITVSRSASAPQTGYIAYKFYADSASAKADNNFMSWYEGAGFYDEYEGKDKPVLTQELPVIAIGITDDGNGDAAYWQVDPIIVKYTVTEGDAEEGVVLTFDPEGNARMDIFGSSPVVLMEGDTVTITPSDDAKGTIYYVFSGSTLEGGDLLETAKTDEMDAAVKVYDPANKPTLPYKTQGAEDGLCFLCAIFRGEDGEWSKMHSANYEVTSSFSLTIPQPVFTPAAGEYTDSVYVQITCSDPNLEIVYAYGYDMVQFPDKTYYPKDSVGFKGLLVKSTTEIYARTVSRRDTNSSWEHSPLVTAKYTIKKSEDPEAEMDTLPMPKFSVAAGEVDKGTMVTLSCDTTGAKIYYSINADTVTANSQEYTAAIAIDSNMTIRAIAVKEGFVSSAIAVAAYTVKEETSANEGRELAGVRLYPNPTEGNFSVEAPVAVKVEIFASNGVIVKAFTMSAGVEEVRLNNSGIYFVRLTAENGQVAVKRVVVR